MKKQVLLLLLILPILTNANGILLMGMTQASETILMYGIILLFLGILFGIDRGIHWFKNYLRKRHEAHTIIEENPPFS